MSIFTDYFSDNSKGWLVKDETEIFMNVENGGYVIEHRQDSSWWATWNYFADHTHADLGIQIKIQKILGASDSYFGIVWGLVDINCFSYVLIYSNKQCVVGKKIDDEWHHITPWKIAPIEQKVGLVNELAIFTRNGMLELHINGFQVLNHEWIDLLSLFSGDNIGFLVGHTMKVKILELKISTGNSVKIPQVRPFTPSPIKRTHVSSSNLKSVGYETNSQILEIEFVNGAVYQYYGVPQHIYMKLMQAESHGKYFYTFVRNRFQYKQVRDKSTLQRNYIDYDDYGNVGYNTSDLKYDLGMDFMSDNEFDTWLEDHTGGRD